MLFGTRVTVSLQVVLAAKDNECVLPGYRKIEWSLNGRTLADLNGEQYVCMC